jgi:hypothetical protein
VLAVQRPEPGGHGQLRRPGVVHEPRHRAVDHGQRLRRAQRRLRGSPSPAGRSPTPRTARSRRSST